jgi:hypothetical protein
MQQSTNAVTSFTRQWSFWSLLGVAFIIAVDIATNLLDFPIRLLLLQVEVWLAERTWRHRRPAETVDFEIDYAAA